MDLRSLLTVLVVLPVFGSLLCLTCSKKQVGYVATLVVMLTFVFGLVAALPVFNEFTFQETVRLTTWFQYNQTTINFAILWDSLAVMMVLMITGIGGLIHLYSIAYMSHDEHPQKYFAYLNLFIFFMLVLVLADNYLMMFIGWEGVGLCSYLLIGFWYKNLDFAKAGKKAFILNRIGDAGLLLAMFLMLKNYGEVSFLGLSGAVNAHPYVDSSLIVVGLFLAVAGKSAQLPLHVWLPDAMAGPTPVSALIHAATMVTAGVYLFVRSAFFLDLGPTLMDTSIDLRSVLFGIFLLTSFLAALSAIFQKDLKKILAYSTMSQLGLMLMAVAVGAYQVAMFHVFTHAFFKAGLFLSAGNVIHALDGEQDINKMGGLWKKIPITFVVYLVCVLSISAVYPFSGFFSKSSIFHAVELNVYARQFMIVCNLLGLLTAIYMTKSLYFVFIKSPEEQIKVHNANKLNSLLFNLPIIVLGLGAAFVGVFWQNLFYDFLAPVSHQMRIHEYSLIEALLKSLKPLVVMIGFIIFWSLLPKVRFPQLYGKFIERGFCLDDFYQNLIVKPLNCLAKFLGSFFELAVLQNTVNSFAALLEVGGRCVSAISNGQVHAYLKLIVLSIIFILLLIA